MPVVKVDADHALPPGLTGALADFLAAVDGSNLGGGNHAAAECEGQVIDWLRRIAGFPEGASGTLTSGGSVANLIGLTVARNRMAGVDLREQGLAALPRPLRVYASDQVHGCHQKAVELLGMGNRAHIVTPSITTRGLLNMSVLAGTPVAHYS